MLFNAKAPGYRKVPGVSSHAPSKTHEVATVSHLPQTPMVAAIEDKGERVGHAQHHWPVDHDPWRVPKLLVSGGLAGGISRTCTAPVDRLKMILQVQDKAKGMTIREGLKAMAAEGSVRSYFRGNGANVLKIAPETAMKLTFNDRMKRVFVENPDRITPLERLMSGAISGVVAQSCIYPLELIRTRLAVSPPGIYKGIYHAGSKILKEEGWRAFYRGITPSTIGILPYAGVDIMMFELLKEEMMHAYEGNPPPQMILGAGMLSSSIAQFVSYPLALIRTRLQAQGAQGEPLKYTGMMDVIHKTTQREGVRGLYKGLVPNLFKLAPAAGISWFVFEKAKMSLGVDPRS